MTAASITPFNFNNNDVRVVIQDGNPWFIASDVAHVLGYRDASNAGRVLDDDEKGTHIVSTLGGDQKITIINESGLYALVLRSRKPEARKFAKWVTSEVLPSIRKTGQYQHSAPTPAAGITRMLVTVNAKTGASHVQALGKTAGVMQQPSDMLDYIGQLPPTALDAATLQKLAVAINAMCFNALAEERKRHTATVDQIKTQLQSLNTAELLELAQESHSLTLTRNARARLPRQLPLVAAH